jgi:hypothetical protein
MAQFGRSASDVVGESGHSDYGAVLDRFLERFGDALLPTTTVVVAGDARTNGQPPPTRGLHLPDQLSLNGMARCCLNRRDPAVFCKRGSIINTVRELRGF